MVIDTLLLPRLTTPGETSRSGPRSAARVRRVAAAGSLPPGSRHNPTGVWGHGRICCPKPHRGRWLSPKHTAADIEQGRRAEAYPAHAH